MPLIDNPAGNYQFLTGIAPYSSGVVALPGYEIIHVTLRQPRPYRPGFSLIERHLAGQERSRQALCAIELRSPKPFTFAGFTEFNEGYQQLLADWALLVDGINPVARTNIAPEVGAPDEPALYAFSYTRPRQDEDQGPTFVIAGAGDLANQTLSPEAIVRGGETSPDALREKATHVMGTMQKRLAGLQVGWEHITDVDIYTVYPLQPYLAPTILEVMGETAVHGVHWFYGHPPIQGLAFEMDMRGVRQTFCIG